MLSSVINFFRDILHKLSAILKTAIALVLAVFIIIAGISFLSSFVLKEGNNDLFFKESVIRDEGGENKIIVAKISGIILPEASTGVLDSTSQTITPQKIQNILLQVKKDPLAKAVVFDIDSPGGSPVSSDRIFEMIESFKKETSIPVIFLMGDIAASGGYYIASAADFIVANPATLTGSIGVIMETYNLENLYNKIGVTKNTFKQGIYKDMLNDSRQITEEEQKIINTLNENTYNLFISRVATGRKLPEDQVRSLATGQVYSGRQAKDLKLIDSLGNIDEAIYQTKLIAKLDRFKVVEYESGSLFQDLFSQTFASFSPLVALRQLFVPFQTLYQK